MQPHRKAFRVSPMISRFDISRSPKVEGWGDALPGDMVSFCGGTHNLVKAEVCWDRLQTTEPEAES